MSICGCLIHAAPGTTGKVAGVAAAMQGVEVHAQTEDDLLVVVVEDAPEALASDLIMSLHQIPAVLSLTLAYHHFEDLPDGERQPEPVVPPCTS